MTLAPAQTSRGDKAITTIRYLLFTGAAWAVLQPSWGWQAAGFALLVTWVLWAHARSRASTDTVLWRCRQPGVRSAQGLGLAVCAIAPAVLASTSDHPARRIAALVIAACGVAIALSLHTCRFSPGCHQGECH